MNGARPTVFIVDDDPDMRRSLERLIRSMFVNVEAHASAQAFLNAYHSSRPGCLVLDVRMPGMTGLELQEKLKAEGSNLPVIFITGHADVPMAVRALKAGAVDFVEKPFASDELLDRIRIALEQDAQSRRAHAQSAEVQARLATLTPREREVLKLVVGGLPTKQIAMKLGISAKTVDVHRSRIVGKMQAENVAALVRMAIQLGELSGPPLD